MIKLRTFVVQNTSLIQILLGMIILCALEVVIPHLFGETEINQSLLRQLVSLVVLAIVTLVARYGNQLGRGYTTAGMAFQAGFNIFILSAGTPLTPAAFQMFITLETLSFLIYAFFWMQIEIGSK